MDSNNYTVIQGWMRTELNLKGNDLLVYAIIYGFSQTTDQKFTGSLQYLADWCGATKQGIMKNLKTLLDRQLISKTEYEKNGVKYCEYSCLGVNLVVSPIKLSLINNIADNKEQVFLSKDKNTKNFDFGKPKEHSPSLYSKCVGHIRQFTNNAGVISSLQEFLTSIAEMKKLRGEKQFVGILNKLKSITDNPGEQIKIIKYSIEHGYATFYDCRESKTYNKKPASTDMGYVSERAKKKGEVYEKF